MKLATRIVVFFLLWMVLGIHHTHAHGGIPRVLSIQPQADALWVIDTLGFFRAPWIFESTSNTIILGSNNIQQHNWQWLCDDAVDAQSGISQASLIGYHILDGNEENQEQALLAMARSGLYRSEDQGCSFQRIEGVLAEHVVTGIFPHPQQTQEVLAITQTLGKRNDVYISEDAGRTWRAIGLNIDGVVYQMWRAPNQVEKLWLHHAEGLSYSEDAGRTWSNLPIETGSLMLRARELSLLRGGYDADGSIRLFMSVNRYPESLLLTSSDQGRSWQQIHSVNDSYDSLIYQQQHLMVATPFEGLFVYDLTGATTNNWQNWIHYNSLFVDCLTSDAEGRIWACGRSEPSKWIVGYTESFGAEWQIMMKDYQSMAEQQQDWNCSDQSESMIACETRCLGFGCDPSGLDMMSFPPTTDPTTDPTTSNQNNEVEREEIEGAENDVVSPPQDEGCTQHNFTGHAAQKVSIYELVTIFCLLGAFILKRRYRYLDSSQ